MAAFGGFSNAFKKEGHDAVAYCDWDKHAAAIYKAHHPSVPQFRNARKLEGGELPDFDVLTAGFPCQPFSNAGLRKGVDDERGTLFEDIARIARIKRPSHLLLENVKGLFSAGIQIGTGFFVASKGGAEGEITGDLRRVENEPERGWNEVKVTIAHGYVFTVILSRMEELGYGLEWNLLNSKHFGVPQNRERVFIAGHLATQCECAEPVFPFRQSDELPPQEARGEREGGAQVQTANTLDSGYSKGGGARPLVQTTVAKTLTGGGHSGGHHSTMTILQTNINGVVREREDAATLRVPTDRNNQVVVTSALTTENARTTANRKNGIVVYDGHNDAIREDGNTPTLSTNNARTVTDRKGIAVGVQGEWERAPLRHKKRNQKNFDGEHAFTVDTGNTGGVRHASLGLRRLTPTECERLQAFDDGWTEYADYGPDGGGKKKVSDTQRYKTLGNAVTVNVVQAIAKKLTKNQPKTTQ